MCINMDFKMYTSDADVEHYFMLVLLFVNGNQAKASFV